MELESMAKVIIKDSSIHGKGAFTTKGIKPEKSWTFKLEKVCCQSHCFAEGLRIGSTTYLGTFDWPFYINSTWPDTTAANLSFAIDANNMILIITTEQFIKKGQELTLPYDWTIHKDSCHNLATIQLGPPSGVPGLK